MKTHLIFVLASLSLWSVAVNAQDVPISAKSDVWLSGKPWALELDGAGFTPRTNEIQADGRRFFLAENTKTRIVVSIFLEASKAPARPGECKHSLEEKVKRNSSLASGPLRRGISRKR